MQPKLKTINFTSIKISLLTENENESKL